MKTRKRKSDYQKGFEHCRDKIAAWHRARADLARQLIVSGTDRESVTKLNIEYIEHTVASQHVAEMKLRKRRK